MLFPSNLKLNVSGVDDLNDSHRIVKHESELLTVICEERHTLPRRGVWGEDNVTEWEQLVFGGAPLTHYDGVDFAFDLECGAVTAEDIHHLSELRLLYQQVTRLILVLL